MCPEVDSSVVSPRWVKKIRFFEPAPARQIWILLLEHRMRHYQIRPEDGIIYLFPMKKGSAAVSLLNKVYNSI